MADCPTSVQDNSRQPIPRILIYGAGWVGRQIAAQMASHGIEASLTDLDDKVTEQAVAWAKTYIDARVAEGTWLATRAEGHDKRLISLPIQSWQEYPFDVVLECVHEQISTKRRVLKSISEQTESSTIIASNSSYFVPSMLAKYVRSPERFAHWHFHVPVWIATISDIVPCESTKPEVLVKLAALSEQMGQRPWSSPKRIQGMSSIGYFNPCSLVPWNWWNEKLLNLNRSISPGPPSPACRLAPWNDGSNRNRCHPSSALERPLDRSNREARSLNADFGTFDKTR